MSNRADAAVTLLLLTCLALEPGAAAAEPMGLPPDTLKAFQAFDSATEQLKKARAAMTAIEAGEQPKSTSEDWAGVIGGYEAAADTIRRSAGPNVPDASAYAVPLDRLKSCTTRPSVLAKLDKQLKALHAAGQRGAETRALLKNRMEAAHAADETRRYLFKTAAKLAGAPLLAEAFTWSWGDFDTRLSRSIPVYVNELKRYQERVDKGNAELKSRAEALAGHLETFRSAKDCLLAGSWSGTKLQAGTMSGLTLVLTSSGASWTGSANLDGEILAVRTLSISGSSVSIGFASGKASMKGTLSGDGRTFHGWLSSQDVPGSFNLQKD